MRVTIGNSRSGVLALADTTLTVKNSSNNDTLDAGASTAAGFVSTASAPTGAETTVCTAS